MPLFQKHRDNPELPQSGQEGELRFGMDKVAFMMEKLS